MSLSLNATLQARLDTTVRHPIVKLTSESFASDIPFAGNSFILSDGSAYEPDVTRLSTEQFAMVRSSNAADGKFYLLITDISRSYWTSCEIQTNHSSYALHDFSICEMTDGNLYITFQYYSGITYYIRGWICDIEGTSVSSTSIAIHSLGSGYVIQDNYVMYDSDAGAYLTFYTYETTAGPTYTLAYKSSSDGQTWSGQVVPSLSGISSSKIIRNVHAMQAADDDIVLTFEYEYDTDPTSGWEVMNTYYSVSQDNGSTWSSPTQVTSYTGWGESGVHPQVEIKDDGTVYFTYSEVVGVSYFDQNTSGVLSDHTKVYPSQLHFYNNWLYCVSVFPSVGTKELSGMYVIDPSDMSLIKQYTQTTTPGFTGSFWSANHAWYTNAHSAGKYMVANSHLVRGTYSECRGVIAVATYDGVDDQVVEYVFNGDLGAYGLTKNITADADTEVFGSGDSGVYGCVVDSANDRLYVIINSNYLYSLGIQIGYIDLTETPDGEGQYTWNEVYSVSAADLCSAYGLTETEYQYCLSNIDEFRYFANNDLLVITGQDQATDDQRLTLIISASQGVVQSCKAYENDTRFPYNGLIDAFVYDNILYGSFEYQSGYAQSSYYGLFVWDMITDTVRLDRPGYIEQNNYYFYDADFSDVANGYIWFGTQDGSVRYDMASHDFELFNEDSVPGYGGIGATVTNKTDCIVRNSATGDIFAGNYWDYPTVWWVGIRKFNPNGAYEIGQYATGTKTGTSLGLGSINDLTIGTQESNIAIVSDEDNVFWAFWNHEDSSGNNDVHWGHDLGAFDFTSDLVKGSALEISWDVEYPSTLNFSCARGHLYDRLNSLSTLSEIFQRGRKISVQLGENISDTEYWQNQGVFIVEEVELSYQRGAHPTINVQCCDLKRLWQEHRIVLTDYYDGQLPDVVIEDLLDSWTVLTVSDYNISSFTNEHTIWTQYADLSFWEIIQNILDHFGYIGHFDVDGIFVNKEVDFDKAVDHTYSDLAQIENLSPQDNYGSFVNQVRVIGETHTEVEVLYEAEQVASRNGTLGWWCEREEVTIYYSEDRTMIGRNPYLDVAISLADFQYFIFKGGGREYISEVDVNNRYCVVTLDGPNLIGVVIGLAISVLAIGYSASTCTVYCGPWIYAMSITTNLLIYALCAVANYMFNIWVQPIGYMKETVQYIAEDTGIQDALNGQTIVEEIEDPLCYTVGQCQMVAEYEADVAKYQRNRLKFRKLYHLQDELLDKLSVLHPYSQQSFEVMITNLKRVVTIGGEVMDEIEGWRIS